MTETRSRLEVADEEEEKNTYISTQEEEYMRSLTALPQPQAESGPTRWAAQFQLPTVSAETLLCGPRLLKEQLRVGLFLR